LDKKKKESPYDSQYKLSRLEIIAKTLNQKVIFFIIDCDKSFCTACEKESCTLEYFFEKNPVQAKVFVNEVYSFVTEKNPELKEKYPEKIDLITYILKKCAGYDNFYDFLFKGNKLISIKFDDAVNLKKC